MTPEQALNTISLLHSLDVGMHLAVMFLVAIWVTMLFKK